MASPSGPARTVERLPLDLRLPNPPPIFVGRAGEAARLEAAIRRAPLCGVFGVGGLGKTALVCHVLHDRFARQVPRVVMARLGSGASLDQLLYTVARALARLRGLDGIDWGPIVADRAALIATAIDVAEPADPRGAEHFIVLDDLHHEDPARAREVLGRLARYARRSRWIAISREDPGLEEAMGQTISLPGMGEGELRELASAWGAGDGAELARAAGGSPWRLKGLLAGGRPGMLPDEGRLTDGLGDTAAAFLRAASVVDAEVPLDVLARIAPAPDAEAIEALVRRGLLERTPAGLRVHDLARSALTADLPRAELLRARARAAEALAQKADPRARLEALRLAADAGDPALARRLFDEHGPALLEGGWPLALQRVLERAPLPELASFRLRVAAEIGDPALLRDLALPEAPTPADLSHHALALFHQGRYDDAAAAAEAAMRAAEAAGDAHVAYAAGFIGARTLLDRGLAAEALSAYSKLTPVSDLQRAQHEVAIIVCSSRSGDKARALELGTALAARVDRMENPSSALRFGVALVLYGLGSVRRAEAAAMSLLGTHGAPVFLPVRHLVLAAALAHDRGRLADFAALVEKLGPLCPRGSLTLLHTRYMRVRLGLLRGELQGLPEEIAALAADARAAGHDNIAGETEAQRHLLAASLGAPPPDEAAPAAPCASRSEDYRELARAAHRARWTPDVAWPALGEGDFPETAIFHALARSAAALADGEPERARALAQDAFDRADEHGYGMLEIEAVERACEALLCGGADEATLRAEVGRLHVLAGRAGAAPIVTHAELLAAVLSPASFEPPRVERVAAAARTAPVAGRRAAALLGETPPLDRVDAAFVEAAQRRTGCRVEVIRRGGPDDGALRRGLVLEDRGRRAWLPERHVDLAARPLLFRILQVLAEGGGEADKETLVRVAWQESDYHPLRHDSRLHTAMRTLRQLLEDDPRAPRRLVTTPAGYAFGADQSVRRIVVR